MEQTVETVEVFTQFADVYGWYNLVVLIVGVIFTYGILPLVITLFVLYKLVWLYAGIMYDYFPSLEIQQECEKLELEVEGEILQDIKDGKLMPDDDEVKEFYAQCKYVKQHPSTASQTIFKQTNA
jgi:hypothetical protein